VGYPSEHYQTLRIAHREIAQQSGVDQTEDCGIGADAEGERENGHERESGTLQEHANAERDVLQEILNPVYAAHVATLLSDLIYSSESPQGCIAGFLWRHSGGDVDGSLLLDVEEQLLLHFAVHGAAME
jgi:hypothetical protein